MAKRAKAAAASPRASGAAAWARRRWIWPAALFLVALALRLIHLLTIRDLPFFVHLGLDPLAYDEWGQRIAAGDWLGNRIFYQDPLYPYFLGVLYAIAGHSYVVVVALQCVLGALVPVLTYDATRRWFPHAAAAAAGSIAAVYVPSIYYEGLILKTWLGAFLVAAALWTLAAGQAAGAGPRHRTLPGPWLATGLLLGLACLVRGNVLLFLPVLAVWLLVDGTAMASAGAAPGSWRRALLQRLVGGPGRAVLWLVLGAALVLGITATRNRVVGGEWILTTSQGGQNFYIGNNPANQTGRYEPLPFVGANPKYEEKGFAEEAQRRTGRSMTPREVSRYWFAQARAWMRSQPADWLRLMWLKFRNYWGAYEVPDNLDFYLYRKSAPVLRLPLAGFGLVAPLGLAGAVLAFKRPGWPRSLLLFMAVYSATVVFFFVFSRYRLPMMPAVFPFAGFALVEIGARLRSLARPAGADAARSSSVAGGGGWAPAVRAPLLFLFLLAFVNLPVAAPADHWTYRLAARLGLPDTRIAGVPLARLESSATGHYNLGLSYATRAEGDDNEQLLRLAVAEFREAARLDPRFAKPHAEMGKALARLGDTHAAIEAYRTVVRMEPASARPHHVLGILYRRTGDYPAAEAALRRALEIDPTRVDSATDLGRVLLAQGRRGEAAAAFRRALRLAPEHGPAQEGLRAAEGSS